MPMLSKRLPKKPWEYKSEAIRTKDGDIILEAYYNEDYDNDTVLDHLVHCANVHDTLVAAVTTAMAYIEDTAAHGREDPSVMLETLRNMLKVTGD